VTRFFSLDPIPTEDEHTSQQPLERQQSVRETNESHDDSNGNSQQSELPTTAAASGMTSSTQFRRNASFHCTQETHHAELVLVMLALWSVTFLTNSPAFSSRSGCVVTLTRTLRNGLDLVTCCMLCAFLSPKIVKGEFARGGCVRWPLW